MAVRTIWLKCFQFLSPNLFSLFNLWNLNPVAFSYTDTPKLSSKLHCNKSKKCWGLLAPLMKATDVRTMAIESFVHNEFNVTDDQD